MPTYRVTAPDSHVVVFEGPAGMSQADIVTRAKQERGFNEGTIQSEPSAGQRAATGFLNTVPNPMDALHAILHPVDTAKSYALHQMEHPIDSVIDSAFPLAGGMASQAAHAGQHIGQGNVAGGMGELAGILLPELAPEIPGAVLSGVRGAGRVTSAVGRGAEMAGQATKKISPMAAMIDAVSTHNPVQGAMIAAAPYAAEAGGRGMQKLGRAMESLGVPEPVAIDAHMPNRGYRSREVPGSAFNEPASGGSAVTSEGLKDQPLYQQMEHFPTETSVGPRVGAAPLEIPNSATRGQVPPYQVPPAEPVTPNAMSPRLAGKAPELNDELSSILQSLGGEFEPVAKLPDTPSVRSIDRQNMDPLEAFASGPRIDRALGSRTPEQAAIYDRGVAGSSAPRENLNEAINTTDVRPRTELPESWKPFADTPAEPASIQGLSDEIPADLSQAIDDAATQERLEGYPNFPPKKVPSFFKGPGVYPKSGKTPAIHTAWEP